MSGTIALQGGREFSPACVEMDRELLARAPDAPAVVLPFAAAPGRECDTAVANAQAYYAALGVDLRPVPAEGPAAVAAVRAAGFVVLPGGSPTRLLWSLPDFLPALAAVLARGGVLSGSSAGAMVLAELVYLPAERAVAPGLRLVPGVAVAPHWPDTAEWVDRLRPQGVSVLGIPEAAAVVVDEHGWTAIGQTASCVVEPAGVRTLPLAPLGEPA